MSSNVLSLHKNIKFQPWFLAILGSGFVLSGSENTVSDDLLQLHSYLFSAWPYLPFRGKIHHLLLLLDVTLLGAVIVDHPTL